MMGIGRFRHEGSTFRNAFLTKIDSLIDDEEIRLLCKKRFARAGRPSYDPAAFFRIMMLGQWLGINSDRKLMELIHDNISYMRFIASSWIPHHSTISRMRKRLGEGFFKHVFEWSIRIAKERGLLDGSEIYTDCTLIEACASDDPRSIEFRKKEGKTYRVNRFDKEAGFVAKRGIRPGFFYKAMYTIDSKARVITDCYVFNGRIFDSVPYLKRLHYQKERFDLPIKRVVADAGFGFGPVLRGIHEMGATPFIPLRSKVGSGKNGPAEGFDYHAIQDIFICPTGHTMRPYSRDHSRVRYKTENAACLSCPIKSTCAEPQPSNRGMRYIARSLYQQEFDAMRFIMKMKGFKKLLRQRQWMIENLFAEGKGIHGLQRARYRGRKNMQIQVYMIAAIQNLKRVLCPPALRENFRTQGAA